MRSQAPCCPEPGRGKGEFELLLCEERVPSLPPVWIPFALWSSSLVRSSSPRLRRKMTDKNKYLDSSSFCAKSRNTRPWAAKSSSSPPNWPQKSTPGFFPAFPGFPPRAAPNPSSALERLEECGLELSGEELEPFRAAETCGEFCGSCAPLLHPFHYKASLFLSFFFFGGGQKHPRFFLLLRGDPMLEWGKWVA